MNYRKLGGQIRNSRIKAHYQTMVQLKSPFFAIIAFATIALASTVADVESDISSISSQVSVLDNAITALPNTGASLLNALAIQTDVTNLATAIDKGTTDVNGVSPKPFSEADGNTILAAIAAFQGLPIGGIPALVRQDLETLNASTSAFENALIASAPTDLKTQAAAIKSVIDAAFSSAIAAYS
ncbi:hypothetical protein BDQ17DRAFT_1431585 [Cyathus striatus]|nr:hypothetical protein BDQ17DRAFT_1431585 [Cyathus striatus]